MNELQSLLNSARLTSNCYVDFFGNSLAAS